MTRRHTTALVLAAGLLLTACGGDDSATTTTMRQSEPSRTAERAETTTSTVAAADPTIAPLCAVLNAAVAGEVDVAKTTFDHGPLHTLADTVTEIDRGVAARLLEAKEAVESDLAAPTPDGAALVDDLEALIAATEDALVATGSPSPPPPTCDSENQ